MRAALGLFVLLLLRAPTLPTAAPVADSPQGPASLAGQLLVAGDDLTDPNFEHTVILIIEADENGTLGIVINRPYGKVPARALVQKLGLGATTAKGQIELYYGGPVQPGVGMVVHSAEFGMEGTRRVTRDIAVTGNPAILKAIAEGRGPAEAIATLGYAGWGPDQLQRELAQGAWTVVPADPALVFAGPPDARWKAARQKRGVDL